MDQVLNTAITSCITNVLLSGGRVPFLHGPAALCLNATFNEAGFPPRGAALDQKRLVEKQVHDLMVGIHNYHNAYADRAVPV